MKLSVIIPVYNEKDTAVELVERTRAVPIDKEIIIVNDGSTDGTRDRLMSRYAGQPGIHLLNHEKNQGKGAAIRTGIARATGEYVIVQDADLEYNPQDFIPILKKLEETPADVVYGTRFKNFSRSLFFKQWIENKFFGAHHEIKQFHLYAGIQALNILANLLYGAGITDEATCYKAFRRPVLQGIKLQCTGFEFCPEVTAKVRKAGYKIYEVPISYHPRSTIEGKKLNWRHGIEAIWALIKYRFTV